MMTVLSFLFRKVVHCSSVHTNNTELLSCCNIAKSKHSIWVLCRTMCYAVRLKQASAKEFLMRTTKTVSSAKIREAINWENELIMHESCIKYESIQLIEKSYFGTGDASLITLYHGCTYSHILKDYKVQSQLYRVHCF